MEKLRIIVGGYIGLYPTGGATLDYIQYPLGLKDLGHDVYYIEDTMQYPVYQKNTNAWNDASGCILYLKQTMELFGMKDKWAYRDVATGKSFGMTEEKIIRLCKGADIFINISCSTFMREEYLKIPKRVLIDSDPMFTQIQYASELSDHLESREWSTRHMMENHNFLFTFGENIGAPDCNIPPFDFNWLTTRQPVCLRLWDGSSAGNNMSFTSIMNWSGRKKLTYNNTEWGQKDIEFEKFKELPLHVPEVNFEVVINRPLNKDSYFNADALRELGWKILEPDACVADTSSYKKFIQNSTAEFSVAKETYVKSNSGWFSCRSACYLATGRPVITEETQWSKFIPSGKGLFAFSDMESAVTAIHKVKSDLQYHSSVAKEVAREYFDSDRILSNMLEKINENK